MKYLILPAAALVLGACTSAPTGEQRLRGAAQFAGDARLGEETDKICFASSIDGFSDTTRDTIVIEEGRDHYLVETYGGCFNLRNAVKVGVDTSSSCLRRGDRLIISDTMFADRDEIGRDVDTCTIKAIYAWDPKADAEDDATEDTAESDAD